MSGLCEVSFGIRDLIALGNQRGSNHYHVRDPPASIKNMKVPYYNSEVHL